MESDTLFRSALFDRWDDLHPAVQNLHLGGPEVSYSGRAVIRRGDGFITGLICRLFRFPPAGEDIWVQVTKVRQQRREHWSRRFGDHTFQSTCMASDRPHHVCERVGLLTFEQELLPNAGGMRLALQRGWCLGLPMPAAFLPNVEAIEGVDDGCFTFDIRLATPSWLPGGSALLVHYKGWLVPDYDLSAS